MPEFDSTISYRDVDGFPGYKIGNDGTLWSCWTKIGLPKGGCVGAIGTVWKQMKPAPKKIGPVTTALHTALHRNRKSYMVRIHTLVLQAFVGPCPEGMECCHFPDPDPTNNHVSNLRWGTPKENIGDREKHGHTAKGEHNGQSTLKLEQVREIKRLLAEGVRVYLIARQFGVSHGCIMQIKLGYNWKWV
jgi:HNH endonuclease